MFKNLPSLNPNDYFYCTPTAEQLAEQQRLLAGPHWRQTSSHVQETKAGCSSSLPAPSTIHSSEDLPPVWTDDCSCWSKVECREADDLMQVLLGQDKAYLANASSSQAYSGQSLSDASTRLEDADEEEAVDLLFNPCNSSVREWMGLEWHHSGALKPGKGCHRETCTPSGAFLKLNYEAAAVAINHVIHKQLV